MPAGAIGYVFQTDCPAEGWSYIGQSTRLGQEHLDGYFGSGYNIKQAIAEFGSEGLQKRVLATAKSEVALHYLEILHIAQARRSGTTVLNGDIGGPRPFPVLQSNLWELAPEVMAAAGDLERFHDLVARKRSLIEKAIVATLSVKGDNFYAGFERDVWALEDLSHSCPACGSPAGAVCRTNATSATKPRNPTWNHKARPRAATSATGDETRPQDASRANDG